ncbi:MULTISPECIES: cation:proton antiporter [unclassified Pseudomonas]|uniref:cation:proton antiporter n=1 Tax=unclassified Pseudomonas TaxID=196821 RepID=UPI0030D7EF64
MFFIQLAVILLACHLFGWLAERLGQCRVVGEITAGIVLGPTVFGRLESFLGQSVGLFETQHIGWLAHVADLGLIFLMFQVGVHINQRHPEASPQGRFAAPSIALLGLVVPFALGVGVALVAHEHLAPTYSKWGFAWFCGVALAVSAVPVMTRIVQSLALQDTLVAHVTLRAAVITDVVGWVILGAIVFCSRVDGDPLDARYFAAQLLVAFAGFYGVTRCLVIPWIRRCQARGEHAAIMPVVISYVLLCAWGTDWLGLHCAIGALLAGLMMKQVPEFTDYWRSQVEGFLNFVLLPVFFACAGIKTSFDSVGSNENLFWLAVFLVCAFAGKFGGAYLGARVSGLQRTDSAIVGALMNTRGLMELIILAIGLELELISIDAYTVLVFMALIITATTTPLVRRLLRPDPHVFLSKEMLQTRSSH